jgi:protein-L-isoaspartate(D-aspartate) O-methyltransferase
MDTNLSSHAQKQAMLSELKDMGIHDFLVLKAMEKVPRHLFVSADLEPYAYINSPLPIDCDQTISQPYIVAFMTQTLMLSARHKVLEIGTGSGYQTAILAEICQAVYTIEIIPALARQAAALLEKLGYSNVKAQIADGHVGWPEAAPFDAIIVTAAAEKLPENLVHQLSVGGHMVIPLHQNKGDTQVLVRITKTSAAGDYTAEDLLDVRFVPMVGR